MICAQVWGQVIRSRGHSEWNDLANIIKMQAIHRTREPQRYKMIIKKYQIIDLVAN